MDSLVDAETQRDSCILSSLFPPSTRLGAAKPLWVSDGSAIGVNVFIVQVKGTSLKWEGKEPSSKRSEFMKDTRSSIQSLHENHTVHTSFSYGVVIRICHLQLNAMFARKYSPGTNFPPPQISSIPSRYISGTTTF